MRKLLVASQKSGVGKTTSAINLAASAAQAGARVLLVETDPLNGLSTSLNLAQHPQRTALKELGIDLPGILYRGVAPGLDILSPYEEGGCKDDDLDTLLHMLSMESLKESYDCLLVNAPPFFGGRPESLLASCDDFLIVMQAEPLAYRTMPAFLELVQRAAQTEKSVAKLRGVLLSLPETESPGGRWERELRGRFGTRVLPHVVPYDAEVGKASLFGQIAVQSAPESPASVAYQQLASELQLRRSPTRGPTQPVEATLPQAIAAVRTQPRVPKPSPRRSSARLPRVRVPEPVKHGGEHATQVLPPAVAERLAARSPARSSPPPRSKVPAAEPPPRRSNNLDFPPLHSAPMPWMIWVGLAMAAGVGLRFIQLPDFALPIIVGLAVAAGVTLVLHVLTVSKNPSLAPAHAAGSNSAGHPEVIEQKN